MTPKNPTLRFSRAGINVRLTGQAPAEPTIVNGLLLGSNQEILAHVFCRHDLRIDDGNCLVLDSLWIQLPPGSLSDAQRFVDDTHKLRSTA